MRINSVNDTPPKVILDQNVCHTHTYHTHTHTYHIAHTNMHTTHATHTHTPHHTHAHTNPHATRHTHHTPHIRHTLSLCCCALQHCHSVSFAGRNLEAEMIKISRLIPPFPRTTDVRTRRNDAADAGCNDAADSGVLWLAKSTTGIFFWRTNRTGTQDPFLVINAIFQSLTREGGSVGSETLGGQVRDVLKTIMVCLWKQVFFYSSRRCQDTAWTECE